MLNINEYRVAIKVDESFNHSPSETDKELIVQALLNEITPEIKIPILYSEKRKLLQFYITLWHPNKQKISTSFKTGLNNLLQIESREKYITDSGSLQSIKEEIPETNYPFASDFILWKGDITTLKVDAIINAANSQMLGCFQPFHKCIDNAIHCAAGIQLREDCYTIIQLQGKNEETGNAIITRAYNLPSKYVLHTVGPIVSNQNPTKFQKEQLASCYLSCLNVALEMNIRSIAFCCISTGVFGYPIEEAAYIALKTVSDWTSLNPSKMESVVFNVFSDNDKKVYSELLRNWK